MESSITTLSQYSLLSRDQRCVWHPYSRANCAQSLIHVTRGEGDTLIGNDGFRYFDAISSWWVTTHGHCHPHIAQAIAKQAAILDQAVFADFTHEHAVRLAERLLKALNLSNGKVFFTDNGSTAVEAALKISIQYWHNKSAEDHRHSMRTKILCFENAYHGDTFGAMSASGKTPFNLPFWPYLFQIETVPVPSNGNEEVAIKSLQNLLNKNDVAAFIFEPVVQGASGMLMHCPKALNEMLSLCHSRNVITIADEVMTGFGRTGPLFACNPFSEKPMITCLSKGITGGFLPLGATICKDEIYEAFIDDSLKRAFLHGHSFCANPIVCAAALASLDLYENPQCEIRRKSIEAMHKAFKKTWEGHPALQRCESAGTILVLEFKQKNGNSGYFAELNRTVTQTFLANGIYIRPMGNVLYLIPPYCSSKEHLEKTYNCIATTLESYL